MLVQAAEAVIGEDTERARKQLDLIGRTARENLAEARALVAGLAPAPLATASLADALARLADRAGEESGLTAEFSTTGEPRPAGTSAEVVLLRVCQEALANVRRHALARSVLVTLSYQDDSVRLGKRRWRSSTPTSRPAGTARGCARVSGSAASLRCEARLVRARR
jgi:signal transduction histidine kinase